MIVRGWDSSMAWRMTNVVRVWAATGTLTLEVYHLTDDGLRILHTLISTLYTYKLRLNGGDADDGVRFSRR